MTTLHHLALGAHDVVGVATFYRQAFGLEFDREHRSEDGTVRSIWLRSDSLLLMIERTDQPRRRVEGVGAGPFLLAFEISAKDRKEVEDRLETMGAPIESRTRHTSYTRDPEGNRVAVSHFPVSLGPTDLS